MNEKVDFKNDAQCFRIKDYHCKTTSFTSVVYLFWIIVGNLLFIWALNLPNITTSFKQRLKKGMEKPIDKPMVGCN